MPKHTVNFNLLVSGSQVLLYFVSDDELKKLISNSKSDRPKAYHELLDSDPHLVYSGIDPIDGDTSIEITVDGTLIEVEGIVYADDSDSLELIKSSKKNKLIVNDLNRRDLVGNIPKDMHVLIVRESYKGGTDSLEFASDKDVHASDFELILLSTDNLSDFSDVTYHSDLLPTELDLVGVVFDGIEVQPELYINHFQDEELFLFIRNKESELIQTEF